MFCSCLFRACVAAVYWLAFSSAIAADLTVTVEIPALDVANYHKPYVALWLEPEQGERTNLAVWYKLEARGQNTDKGEEWLKDLRQWWRRLGRDTDMPIDGVSGATRAPGKHSVRFTEGSAPLGTLTSGNYVLMLEAVREDGDRELIKIAFTWPVQTTATQQVSGRKEVGEVTLTLTP